MAASVRSAVWILVVVTACAGGFDVALAQSQPPPRPPILRDVLRIIDFHQRKVKSIFDKASGTVVAPLAATDQAVAFVLENANHLTLSSRLVSVGTTTPLIIDKALSDIATHSLLPVEPATSTEVSTQSFGLEVPPFPTTIGVGFVIDSEYPWRELPPGVKYQFYVKDAVTGEVAGGVSGLTVVPRGPTTPTIRITQPEKTLAWPGIPVNLVASASDPFDGPLTGPALIWRRLDLGPIGVGNAINPMLPPGRVAIRVDATNSCWATTAATLLIDVIEPMPPTTAEIVLPAPGTSVPYGTAVTMSGRATCVVDGELGGQSLKWIFPQDGGMEAAGSTTSYVFVHPALHNIELRATNQVGAELTTSTTIWVEPPVPSAEIISPVTGAVSVVGEAVQLLGWGAAPPEGQLVGEALIWEDSLNGRLGSGESLTVTTLVTGIHIITLVVNTPYGKQAVATKRLEVLPGYPPEVTIRSPLASAGNYYASLPIRLVAFGWDGWWLPQEAIVWESSQDGVICTQAIADLLLTTGTHILKATATASNGTTSAATVAVTVHPVTAIPPALVELTSPGNGATYFTGQIVEFMACRREYLPNTDGPYSHDRNYDEITWTMDGTPMQPGRFWMQLPHGSHTVTATTTDSRGKTSTATAQFLVEDGSDKPPPVIWLQYPEVDHGSRTPYRDVAIKLRADANDFTGASLRDAVYSWTSNLNGVIGSTAAIRVTTLVTGVHTITCSASDSRPKTATATRTIEILPRPNPTISGGCYEGTFNGNPFQWCAWGADVVDGPTPITLTSNREGVLMTAVVGDVGWGWGQEPPKSNFVLSTGHHIITAETRNSRGMTARCSWPAKIWPLYPSSSDREQPVMHGEPQFGRITRERFTNMENHELPEFRFHSPHMVVRVDEQFIDQTSHQYGNMYGLPIYRVTTPTISLTSYVHGKPTTVTVNGTFYPVERREAVSVLSIPDFALATGTNMITLSVERPDGPTSAGFIDRFVTTYPIVYMDFAVNHPPRITDASVTQIRNPGAMFPVRMEYLGWDEEWDGIGVSMEVSTRPADVATAGDWVEADTRGVIGYPGYYTSYGLKQAVTCSPMTTGPTGRAKLFYEGTIWVRARSFDGKEWGPYCEPVSTEFDNVPPRGLHSSYLIGQEVGAIRVGWEPAVDPNFDTYTVGYTYTDRWAEPSDEESREVDTGSYLIEMPYWMIYKKLSKQDLPVLGMPTTTACTVANQVPGVNIGFGVIATDTFNNRKVNVTSFTTRTANDFGTVELERDFISPAPNPYGHELVPRLRIEYELVRPLPVSARVYRVDKYSVVRTLEATGLAGMNYLDWDGTNEQGDLVEDGSYGVRLETLEPGRPVSRSNVLFFDVFY